MMMLIQMLTLIFRPVIWVLGIVFRLAISSVLMLVMIYSVLHYACYSRPEIDEKIRPGLVFLEQTIPGISLLSTALQRYFPLPGKEEDEAALSQEATLSGWLEAIVVKGANLVSDPEESPSFLNSEKNTDAFENDHQKRSLSNTEAFDEDELPLLEEALKSNSLEVRVAALKRLKKINTAEAHAIIEAYVKIHTDKRR